MIIDAVEDVHAGTQIRGWTSVSRSQAESVKTPPVSMLIYNEASSFELGYAPQEEIRFVGLDG